MIVKWPHCPHCGAEYWGFADDVKYSDELEENFIIHYDVICSHCKKSYQFDEVYEFSHYTMKDGSE